MVPTLVGLLARKINTLPIKLPQGSAFEKTGEGQGPVSGNDAVQQAPN